jgi:hypothetical protein
MSFESPTSHLVIMKSNSHSAVTFLPQSDTFWETAMLSAARILSLATEQTREDATGKKNERNQSKFECNFVVVVGRNQPLS